MSITSKKGDHGKTRLASGEEVYKNAARLDACGDLDELVSLLGLARCRVRYEKPLLALEVIQADLLQLASFVATSPEEAGMVDPAIDQSKLEDLTQRCVELEELLKPKRGFVVPGSSLAGAHLDHARAVTRRCERKVVGLFRSGEVWYGHAVAWLNRLSDYLWLLARLEEEAVEGGADDTRPC